MKEKREIEDIVRVRKETLSEITQTLIYFEHIKDLMIVIIRCSISPKIPKHDNEVIRILTDSDNVHNLSQKLLAIYKLFNKDDDKGLDILKKLIKKFQDLAATRNSLAHSNSVFLALTDEQVETHIDLSKIQIRGGKLTKTGYSSKSKKVGIEELVELNLKVKKLEKAFSSFMFACDRPKEEKDKIFEKELSSELLESFDLKF